MQIQDFIPDIRKMLDTTVQSAYTDLEIAKYIVDAFRHLHATRPESRYDASSRLVAYDFPSDDSLLSFEVDIPERWRIGIVYYAVARCHEVGITDSVNLALSITFKKEADAVFAT